MDNSILVRHKRRTRQHVIADISVHHVEGFILKEGHTVQRLGSDYGFDLILFTFDAEGYAEPGLIYFQCKAMDQLDESASDVVYDVDIRDYNLWLLERSPVILILYDASRRRAFWLAFQRYFREDAARQPKKGAKTVRVRVPQRQAVNRRAIGRMRDLKWETQLPLFGANT
jgi:Domain of unknown function (DUF4365)